MQCVFNVRYSMTRIGIRSFGGDTWSLDMLEFQHETKISICNATHLGMRARIGYSKMRQAGRAMTDQVSRTHSLMFAVAIA